jgi:hypothetical protein
MNQSMIIRKAVGRNARIGQFYNVINEEIPNITLFNFFEHNPNYIQTEKCIKDILNIHVDENDTFKIFQIDIDLKFSINSKLLPNKFCEHILDLKDKINLNENKQISRLVFEKVIITKETNLVLNNLKQKLWAGNNNTPATHVINVIKYGLIINVSFEYLFVNENISSKNEIINELRNLFQMAFDGKELTTNQMSLVNGLEFQIFDNFFKETKAFNDIRKLIARINFLKKNVESIIHTEQIEFSLMPLSYFKLKLETTYYLDHDYSISIDKIQQKFDTIRYDLLKLQTSLSKYTDYLRVENALNYIEKLFLHMNKYHQQLVSDVLKFKSLKQSNLPDLNESLKTIESKYKRIIYKQKENFDKIKEIDYFTTNGIIYLKKGQQINLDSSVKIILCYSQTLKIDQWKSWDKAFGKFTQLKIFNSDFTYFVYDYDINKCLKISKNIKILFSINETFKKYDLKDIQIPVSFVDELRLESQRPKKEINIVLLGIFIFLL